MGAAAARWTHHPNACFVHPPCLARHAQIRARALKVLSQALSPREGAVAHVELLWLQVGCGSVVCGSCSKCRLQPDHVGTHSCATVLAS